MSVAPELTLFPRRSAGGELLDQVDELRLEASSALDPGRRAEMGQFMTPPPVARLMASMLSAPEHLRLLDPGAGTGSLLAAVVEAVLSRPQRPKSIAVTAYEVEPVLLGYLDRTLALCAEACEQSGVEFVGTVEASDFLQAAAHKYAASDPAEFNAAILNPPYRKIRTESLARKVCRAMGLEVSNLYPAFVGATVHLLEPGAVMVAITPRSFANGPYFRAFRRFLLDRVAIRRFHVFDSRQHAFRDDDVLQENLILCGVRGINQPQTVEVAASETPSQPARVRSVPWGRVVYEHDREQFIHLITDPTGDAVAEQMARFDNYLDDLGIAVSTGPVVDFRVPDYLRRERASDAVPLLYPGHLCAGSVRWPAERVKWNALTFGDATDPLTIPRGNYVLVKRFTAKEEPRRVVAAVLEAGQIPTERVGLENHLNYFHDHRCGLPIELARGLTLYLNSSLVDRYFRQFSGHTQVNAADLRNMPYPPRHRLEAAGRGIGAEISSPGALDRATDKLLL